MEWSFETGGPVFSSPAVADVDGDGSLEVVVGSLDNRTYCLDGATGREEWSFETGDAVVSSPAAADVDGDGLPEIVAASRRGVVRCLGVVGRTLDPVVGVSIPIAAALAAWATVRLGRRARRERG